MFNEVYIPNHNYSLIDKALISDSNLVCLERVDCSISLPFESLLREKFDTSGNYPFVVFADKYKIEEFANLLMLVCHPKYYGRTNRRVIIGYTGDNLKKVKSDLEELFKKQNMSVEVIVLPESILDDDKPVVVHIRKDNEININIGGFLDEYYRYVLTDFRPDDFFVVNQTLTRIEDVVASAAVINKRLAGEHKQLHRHLKDSLLLRKRIAIVESENKFLRQDLDTINELLRLKSQQDEVNYILNFYKYEYEILPVWYKRLGHLIKVVTGKRKFKSLFDDNIEKYKR